MGVQECVVALVGVMHFLPPAVAFDTGTPCLGANDAQL